MFDNNLSPVARNRTKLALAAMESEDEAQSLSSTSRMPRAMTAIALSVLAILIAGIAYVHPNAWFEWGSRGSAGKQAPAYQLATVDFVTPSVGWVVMERPRSDFALLRTSDAGVTWTRQLAGSAGEIGEYARFFDRIHGVIVLLGPQAAIYQTSDGGSTWSRHSLPGRSYVWSADFVDPKHGWLLAQGSTEGEVLFRTVDGGVTWTALGNPVLYSDWAYRVVFANASDGWLYSHSTGPYAYKSSDGGTKWSRVALPAPSEGWPSVQGGVISAGDFFVAAHPTEGAGVITTVIGVAPRNGRLRVGGVLVGYPPLQVSTYDGGRPVTNTYPAVGPYRYSSAEHLIPGPLVSTQPANQFQLSSVDGGVSWRPIITPSDYGTVGFVDAVNWWWIGSGEGSTTPDAGMTWTQTRGLGVLEPLPGSLHFIDSNHAWFGAMAGTRPLVESTDDGGVHWTMLMLPELTPT
jgi:photosystem II stability/assembly factor-like uncharacterized protein